MKKKILFLGGSIFQISPIIYAKEQGFYVITCDYLPNNPGHKYADEYYNVSTTNPEEVLQLAERLSIDGIVAYASDPSASTASYVANKLNLPGNPFDSVQILTNKDLFRNFLRVNNFNTPASSSFSFLSEAMAYFQSANKPVMIKPVDSSGSKGVSKIHNAGQLPLAFDKALSFSRSKRVIIEEYVEKKGYQIAGDGFILDGKLVFHGFAQEHFTNIENQFVPIGESFPLQLPNTLQLKIISEINRLMSLLKMNIGSLNFDIMIDHKDEIYLMEIGPRGGGNFISDVIKYSTGVDLAKLLVDAALGIDSESLVTNKESLCYSSYMLHSNRAGIFKDLEIESAIQENIVESEVFIQKGDYVNAFENSSHTLGYFILRFDSSEEMLSKMDLITEQIKIKLEE